MANQYRGYQWFIIFVGLFFQYGWSLIAQFTGFNERATGILCIFLGTLLLFFFIDLMWPAVSCILSFAITDIYSFTDTLTYSFGHNIFWFVILSGIVIGAIDKTGILRRIAIWMISRRFTRRSPWLFIGTLLFTVFVVGFFLDCTAATILFTAIMANILKEVDVQKGDQFGAIMMFSIMVIIGISFGGSAIGHSVAIATIGMFGHFGLNMGNFCLVGGLIGIICYIVYMIALRFIFKLDVSKIKNYDPTMLNVHKTPISKREICAVSIYGIVILLWLSPAFTQSIWPAFYDFYNGLGQTVPLLLATVVMSLIRIDHEPLINLDTDIRKNVPWSAGFLVAAAMILSTAMGDTEAGIPETIGSMLGPIFADVPILLFVLGACFISTTMTNYAGGMICMVTANSIVLTLMESGVITNVSPGLAMLVSMCSAFAYATPAAGTYSAIVAGQGWVSRKQLFLWGNGTAYLLMVILCTIGYQIANAVI